MAQGAMNGRDQVMFGLEYCKRRRVGRGFRDPPSPMKRISPMLNASYIIQFWLASHRHLVTTRLISTFNS